jgi:hypothetical protein
MKPVYFINVRSPSNKVKRLALSASYHTLKFHSSKDTLGQWMLYQPPDITLRIFGVHNTSRLELIAGSMIFSSSMDDVGEEFIVLISQIGIDVIRIVLSPPKCPIEHYHNYVHSFANLLGFPLVGNRSIGGTLSSSGRQPTPDEYISRLIHDAANLLQSIALLSHDIRQHERCDGGWIGVDPQKTLREWRSNPNWYNLSEQPSPHSICVDDFHVIPLKTVPANAKGNNLFVSALLASLRHLVFTLPPTNVGGLVARLLEMTRMKAKHLDKWMEMDSTKAWQYLSSKRHSTVSQSVVDKVLMIKNEINFPSPHNFGIAGMFSYYLRPPELIFQSYAVAECMISMGVPIEQINEAMQISITDAGFQCRGKSFWVDTPKHGMIGWRDNTNYPSDYRPDLVIKDHSSESLIIIDAKFRRNHNNGYLTSDSIKDLQAYMQEYRISKSVILSPHLDGDSLIEDLQSNGYWIRAISVAPFLSDVSRQNIRQALSIMWDLPITLRD